MRVSGRARIPVTVRGGVRVRVGLVWVCLGRVGVGLRWGLG